MSFILLVLYALALLTETPPRNWITFCIYRVLYFLCLPLLLLCVCVYALLNHRVPENFHIVLDILLIRCVRRRLLYNIIYTQSANSESKVMGNIDLIYPTKLTCVFAVCARARAPSAPSERARAYTVRSTDRIGNSVGAASKRCCRAADYDDPL